MCCMGSAWAEFGRIRSKSTCGCTCMSSSALISSRVTMLSAEDTSAEDDHDMFGYELILICENAARVDSLHPINALVHGGSGLHSKIICRGWARQPCATVHVRSRMYMNAIPWRLQGVHKTQSRRNRSLTHRISSQFKFQCSM
jgi:hypothetical protein